MDCCGNSLDFTHSLADYTVICDTARTNQHKDRYSALAMVVRYIAELENERKRKMMFPKDACIGVVSKLT